MVVAGAGGRLGSALVRGLASAGHEVVALGRAQMDLADEGLVERVLGGLEFDVMVNAAACTAVDDCERDSAPAYRLNAEAPRQLAALCSRRGVRLVHFSTDYVFDGKKEEPYTEEDVPRPLSVYGHSKLAGERAVQEAGAEHLVVRLSWLFGPGRPAFPEWVLREAAARGEVPVVADKWGCPTWSVDAAQWVEALISCGAGGVVHLCNSGVCAWNEWAEEVLRAAGSSARVVPISLADLPGLKAVRPQRSGLATGRFTALTGLMPRAWQEAVREHVEGRLL